MYTINKLGIIYEWDSEYYYQKAITKGHKPYDKNTMKLENYLKSEKAEGKSEFRLVVNNDGSFYIHPYNQDGETYNGQL